MHVVVVTHKMGEDLYTDVFTNYASAYKFIHAEMLNQIDGCDKRLDRVPEFLKMLEDFKLEDQEKVYEFWEKTWARTCGHFTAESYSPAEDAFLDQELELNTERLLEKVKLYQQKIAANSPR